MKIQVAKKYERDRTRTCNPLIRSQVPYPLGHTPFLQKGYPILAVVLQLSRIRTYKQIL